MKTNRLLTILSVLVLVFTSCTRHKEYRKFEGVVWNTTFSITYASEKVLDDSIRNAMRMVELSLSPFNKASVITLVNQGDSVEVDSMIKTVFNASKQVNRQSGGLFDPTLAPLINAYGFGYAKGEAAAPAKEQIDSLLAIVGIADCRIENNRMIKKHPLTQFNFSAITKGFGVDEVARTLVRNGVSDYLVEIGGEIRTGGLNPDRKEWRIQIDAPEDNGEAPIHKQLMTISLTDIAVATSGNYRNNKTDSNGKKIGHTISPLTGNPVQVKYLSVTVIAPECMTADAWATAIMAGTPLDSLPSGLTAYAVEFDESRNDYNVIQCSN